MKLGKDEIQKFVLGGLGIAAALYAFFTFLTGPLAAQTVANRAQIDTLGPQIEEARKLIADTAALEEKAPEATATYEEIKSMIPAGAPVAWFPPRIVEFFRRQGVEAVNVQRQTTTPLSDLPGFQLMTWIIDLPKTEFIPLAIAISGLENEEPLLSIPTLRISASGSDVQHPSASLTVDTIMTQ